jgi:hypothetical protein
VPLPHRSTLPLIASALALLAAGCGSGARGTGPGDRQVVSTSLEDLCDGKSVAFDAAASGPATGNAPQGLIDSLDAPIRLSFTATSTAPLTCGTFGDVTWKGPIPGAPSSTADSTHAGRFFISSSPFVGGGSDLNGVIRIVADRVVEIDLPLSNQNGGWTLRTSSGLVAGGDILRTP